MEGFGQAARQELLARYTAQAMEQGIPQEQAMALAERAAAGTLGPAVSGAGGGDIWRSQPQIAPVSGADLWRNPPRAAVPDAPGSEIWRTQPEKVAADDSSDFSTRRFGQPYVRRNTLEEAQALMETAGRTRPFSYDSDMELPDHRYVRPNSREENAAMTETNRRPAPDDGTPRWLWEAMNRKRLMEEELARGADNTPSRSLKRAYGRRR